MKIKTSLIAVLLIASAPLTADVADWRAVCEKYSTNAYNIMEHRQRGTSMVDMMNMAGGEDALEKMTIDAYDSPRFSIEEKSSKKHAEF